ncbi:hypothetical protein BC829DRAFT_399917 [Chytridium lagenaria]|nr:hypothetical protein BC829DRAFT_399917 [Chytridium lagenaria]
MRTPGGHLKGWRLMLLLLLAIALLATRVLAESDIDDVEDVEDAEDATPGSYNWQNLDPMDFKFEALGLAGLLVYLALHYYGRSVNLGIAKKWLQATLPVWESNFAQVGDGNFVFYATGRRYVQKVYGYIKLQPRFDLVGYLQNITVPDSSKTDKVQIIMTLDPALEGLVFSVLSKRASARIIKGRYDLTDFAIGKTYPKLPKEYVVMTDAPEFAAALADDERFISTLWASLGLNEKGEGKAFRLPVIESIIVTDQGKDLPKKEILKKQRKSRKEELAKMKQDALRKKEQEVSKMSPEEQRKWRRRSRRWR